MNELIQSGDVITRTQPRNTLTLMQQIEVLEKLKGICRKIEEGEETFATYSDGFNDKATASMFSTDLGFLVTPSNIQKVRRDAVGPLRRPKSASRGIKGRMTDAETRINDLQRQVAAQHDMIGDLVGDFKAHIESMRAHGRATQGSP